ncbi:MAG TPA: PEP-CTERM sorting domain-containing protein [Phycisphaerae bacterium]|nr:PEP-CTERM sorting domain-containing protein [Phycisphaerae bacterium]
MLTRMSIVATVLACAGVAARADFMASSIQSAYWASGPTTAAPGQAFDLDYNTIRQQYTIKDIAQVNLTFEASGLDFGHLKVTLNADPNIVYSFPETAPGQLVYALYDPNWINPSTIPYGKSPIDGLWKAELMDGILSGRLWVEGVTAGTPSGCTFAATTTFVVPEPGIWALLALGGPAALRRRRDHRRTAAPR